MKLERENYIERGGRVRSVHGGQTDRRGGGGGPSVDA